LGRYF
jgi:hypothetical protein